MKKTFFKRALSLVLSLVMLLSLLPMTLIEAGALYDFPIQRQTDAPWNTVYFNGGSLAGTGCGLFSLVNAVGCLTGQKMDVVELATWAHNNGMYNVTGADGTYRTSFYHRASERYGPKYGFTIDTDTDKSGYWSGAYDEKLKKHLENGGTAVIHVYNHFMALVGYDRSSNKFHLYDCAPRDRRNTLANGGDLWFTEAQLSSGYTDIDWFCLLSSTRPQETWVEKAAFDVMVYRDRNADLKDMTDAQLKEHWLKSGIKEGRASSTVLDLGFYLNNNPDLKEAYGTDYTKVYNHFITKGYKEGRKSSALFDGSYYCTKYPEVKESFKDDYMRHYVENGMKEGRRASLTFDPNYYWFIRPDVYNAWPDDYTMCARHYAGHGIVAQVEAYDNKHPVISNVKISDVSAAGYTVTCEVTDNWGLSKVAFPTWTLLNNQDDLAADFMNTQKGTKNGNTYTFRVNASDHNNETGKYATHIYALDKGGNQTKLSLEVVDVKDPVVEPPVVDDPVIDTPVVDPVVEEITLISATSYTDDGSFLKKVKASTTVSSLLSQFDNDNLKVFDKNGNVLSSSAKVGTGAKINLYNGSKIVDSLTVVVAGDVDGNAVVDTTDYMRVKQAFLRSFTLSDIEKEAADVEINTIIDSTDCMRIKSHFLGSYNLFN